MARSTIAIFFLGSFSSRESSSVRWPSSSSAKLLEGCSASVCSHSARELFQIPHCWKVITPKVATSRLPSAAPTICAVRPAVNRNKAPPTSSVNDAHER
jgi:hypothetical protein